MPEFKPYLGDNIITLTKIENGQVVDSIDLWRSVVANQTLYSPEWKNKPEECGSNPNCGPQWGIDSKIRFVTYCLGCQNWEMGHHSSKEN